MFAMVYAEREMVHGAQKSVKNKINKTEAQFYWCLELIHLSVYEDIATNEISNYWKMSTGFHMCNTYTYVYRRPRN